MLPLPFTRDAISLDYGVIDYEFYYPGSPHQGVDFSSRSRGISAGTTIPASGEGRVTRSGVGPRGVSPDINRPNNLSGNSIDVDYGPVVVRYMHRPYDSHSPAPGDRVYLGSSLGVIGSSGQVSAPHLHMETWDKSSGRRVDPRGFFDYSRYVGDGSPSYSSSTNTQVETDDMFTDSDRAMLQGLVRAQAAPINFRSTTGGVSYTMIPGIQIIRHENEIAAALTLEFVTGEKYPGANATQQQREAIGERQINDAEILVMLAKFGFEWASRDIARLPEVGKVLYADWIMQIQGVIPRDPALY